MWQLFLVATLSILAYITPLVWNISLSTTIASRVRQAPNFATQLRMLGEDLLNAETIDVVRRQHRDEAMKIINTGHGKQLMDDFRALRNGLLTGQDTTLHTSSTTETPHRRATERNAHDRGRPF